MSTTCHHRHLGFILHLYYKWLVVIQINHSNLPQPAVRTSVYYSEPNKDRVLIPLLFSLFLNELPLLLDQNPTDPISLQIGHKLNTLFYADDLVILSRSKYRLQNCLNSLPSFCFN